MTRKLLSLFILIAIAAVLQACAKKPDPETSCSFVQNGDMQRVSWGGDTPVVLYIDDSVPNVYNDAISAAIHDWNTAVGREVLKLGGRVKTTGIPERDGVNTIYYLREWERDHANEQARTTVYWSGDRIYEADVRINALDHDFFWGTDPVPGKVDMQSLMLHEFGHVLGLAHTEGKGETAESVMVRSLPTALLRRSLAKSDLSSIRCEY
jgi:predicted Zn-dependent protease